MKEYTRRAQEAYLKRQAQKGLVRVMVQVPEGDREYLKKVASALREGHALDMDMTRPVPEIIWSDQDQPWLIDLTKGE